MTVQPPPRGQATGVCVCVWMSSAVLLKLKGTAEDSPKEQTQILGSRKITSLHSGEQRQSLVGGKAKAQYSPNPKPHQQRAD